MVPTYAQIEVENLFTKRAKPLQALVNSGFLFLSVPENIAKRLGFDLTEAGIREVVLANGRRQSVPMIGPLRVHFADRYCDLSALARGPADFLEVMATGRSWPVLIDFSLVSPSLGWLGGGLWRLIQWLKALTGGGEF